MKDQRTNGGGKRKILDLQKRIIRQRWRNRASNENGNYLLLLLLLYY